MNDPNTDLSDPNADLEEHKRSALLVFGNAIRASADAGSVNLQMLQLGFMKWLEGLEIVGRGGTLDAKPYYNFLLQQGVSPDGAAEVILILRSLEDRIGFFIRLPAEVDKLSETKKQVLLERYLKRTRGPTYAQQQGPAPGQNQVQAQAQRDDFKRRKPLPRGTGLAFVGLLSIGAMVALRVFEEKPPPLETVDLALPQDAFACREITRVRKMAMCKMTVADWDALSASEAEAKLKVTAEFFTKNGFSNVFIITSEDNKTRCGK